MNNTGITGLTRIPLPGRNLPEAVARFLIDCHSNSLPDLSGLVVLVPNHRAGQDFAKALAREAALPALIPPLITPLKAWAASHATTTPDPQTRRLARLHSVLKQQKWLGEVDRWALAGELLQLADELSAARFGEEVGARIRALNGNKLNRETALIEEVWRAMNTNGTDPQAVYVQSLQAIPTDRPVYGFALGPLTKLENDFLERIAHHVPSTLFQNSTPIQDSSPVKLFPKKTQTDGVPQTLYAAWLEPALAAPLRERALQLATTQPSSPLHTHFRLNPAAHLEAEARGVATWVAEQLQAGHENIALIALDRETARRTRALLERMDVLVADETGWTLSTTAAAAVIDRWLECLANDFPHTELLDLLKSPFVLGELAERQDAVLALETAMRKRGVAQGLEAIRRLASGFENAVILLDTLTTATRSFPQTRTTLANWLQRLLASLDQLHATVPLSADAAGASVLDTLKRLQHELLPDPEKYSFNEWRRWLNLALESETFTDTRVVSPIVLTSLPNSRGRQFDAVALIGADAAHLPAKPAPGLFSQSIRAQLGLPVAADSVTQTTEDLLQLLSQGHNLLSWQTHHNDEPNPTSSYVLRLQALHQAAWQSNLDIQSTGQPPAIASAPTVPQPTPSQQPAPSVPPHHLPRRYAASAYQTLLDCPYRFFVKHVLNIRELDEADDPLDKSDYGTLLHKILKTFHDSQPPQDAEKALARLTEISAQEFSALPAYTAAAWHSKWTSIQAAYIDAWLDWVAQGWQYQSGETDFSVAHNVAGLGEITLHGRIDRVDEKNGHHAVIDYKTGAASGLRKKLKDPGEHIQLPWYAWLANAAATFLPINEAPVTALELDGETDVEAISLRLPELLEAIAAGSALRASGVESVCQYCEARGLCRKGVWAP